MGPELGLWAQAQKYSGPTFWTRATAKKKKIVSDPNVDDQSYPWWHGGGAMVGM